MKFINILWFDPGIFREQKTRCQQQATPAGRNAGFQPAFGPTRANPPAPTHSCTPFIKSRQTVQPLKESRDHLKKPSLDDWEKEWGKNSQRRAQPNLLPVDFRSPLVAIAQSN